MFISNSQSMWTRLKTSARLPSESWWWTDRHLRWLVGSLTTQWKRGSPGHLQNLLHWPSALSPLGPTAQRKLSSEIAKWESCRRSFSVKRGRLLNKTQFEGSFVFFAQLFKMYSLYSFYVILSGTVFTLFIVEVHFHVHFLYLVYDTCPPPPWFLLLWQVNLPSRGLIK